MAHFYLDEHLTSARPGDLVSIAGQEARHAITVSRIRVGEQVRIGNGAGLVVTGTVHSAGEGRLEIAAERVTDTPPPTPAIWLAQALAKGGRDEAAVQAACELGVDGVIPWSAERSIVKWDGQRSSRGRDRWTAIVRESTKQSMRPRLPEVSAPVATAGLARLTATMRLVVLVPGSDAALSDIRPDGRDLLVVVGPEGGIAPREVEVLLSAGATPLRLGPDILRTSTAGPAAIAVLNVALGRW